MKRAPVVIFTNFVPFRTMASHLKKIPGFSSVLFQNLNEAWSRFLMPKLFAFH
jgi:hypothetical protein